jgi:hypothetical protein
VKITHGANPLLFVRLSICHALPENRCDASRLIDTRYHFSILGIILAKIFRLTEVERAIYFAVNERLH